MDTYATRLFDEFLERNQAIWGVDTGILGVSDDGTKLVATGYDRRNVRHKVVIAAWIGSHLLVRKASSYEELKDVVDNLILRSVEHLMLVRVTKPIIIWTHSEINDDTLEEWKLVAATKGIT